MSVDPYVVRSQRNRRRQPVTELLPSQIYTKNEQKQGTDSGIGIGHDTRSKLRMVKSTQHLGYFSLMALIFNRVVGGGIFVTPALVLALVGSKGIAIVLWVIGGVIQWAGLMIYLEYGRLFSLTGGELHYIDLIWQRPRMLLTYAYSYMFVILAGCQFNAIIFSGAVFRMCTPPNTPKSYRLQKFIGIVLISAVCVLQSYSRMNYVRFSNFFALYKVLLLTAISIIGWLALGNIRSPAAQAETKTSYGSNNFHRAFMDINSQPYAIALAMLIIMRTYGGYESANFVLEEVRRPPGHEDRVFKRSTMIASGMITFFYVSVNIALFAACTKDELLDASNVLTAFFQKVFGHSAHNRLASGTIIALSAAGNVISSTYTDVLVKQEIARLGVLPFPAFWAKSTRLNTPGPALLLHWIFSCAFILATPLHSSNGYLAFSTLFTYARTLVSILITVALLAAPWLSAFQNRTTGKRWGEDKSLFARITLYAQASIYLTSSVMIFVVSWFPAKMQETPQTNELILPTYLGPLVVMLCYAVGVLLWGWDLHILPVLGWKMEPLQEERIGLTIHMTFQRTISGFSEKVIRKLHLERYFDDNNEDKDESDDS